MPSTPESEETRPTDAEVEAARCPDTTAKVLSPLARAMVEEAQAMKAHADYCFPDTGGVATIRRAIFLSRGGHKSGEVCHYQEWTGERILHAAGCAYFGIQDDTVPCQCPIVRANAAAALRQPREGAEAERLLRWYVESDLVDGGDEFGQWDDEVRDFVAALGEEVENG